MKTKQNKTKKTNWEKMKILWKQNKKPWRTILKIPMVKGIRSTLQMTTGNKLRDIECNVEFYGLVHICKRTNS